MLTFSKQQQKNKYVLIIQMTFTYEQLFIQFSMFRIVWFILKLRVFLIKM